MWKVFHIRGVQKKAVQRIKQEGDTAQAHLTSGNHYRNQGMSEHEIAVNIKAIECDPGLAEHHHNLGTAYRDRGMYQEAIAEYVKAIEISTSQTYDSLGSIYYRIAWYGKAISAFEKALEIDPHNQRSRKNLDICNELQRRYRDTIADHGKAIQIAPGFEMVMTK